MSAANPSKPLFVTVGSNPARAFGMDAADRARAIAAQGGMEPAEQPRAGRSPVIGNLAFSWDPAWNKAVAARPGTVLVKDGGAVLAHVPADGDVAGALEAIQRGEVPHGEALDADSAELNYPELRKRERPFVLRLDPADPEPAERAAYDASYKGVTDLLTLYLWRKPAFYLTRWAARAGMSPNQITLIGFVLCVATFFLWKAGWFWLGMASALIFMVLDTVDGKLARCTGQSSWWGNIFDHGIDLVHPPFWWWAWIAGLGSRGDPFEPVFGVSLFTAIVGGYIAQRVIEGIFMRQFGMHIHVWRPIDSRFRLITARRNPNMVILFVALLLGRPDKGIEYVGLWTLVSLVFHAVRLAQANERRLRRAPVTSWLA